MYISATIHSSSTLVLVLVASSILSYTLVYTLKFLLTVILTRCFVILTAY